MTVKMMEMTWHDFKNKVESNALVVLPVGSIEAHGMHLPLAWMLICRASAQGSWWSCSSTYYLRV